MFATTFLGHQGWMFRTESTCVLVDPLLCEPFGQIHALEYEVWPPRVWTWGELPRVDALVLSHEHDDHFDLASLAKIDRAIPVYLSARSSRAARDILATMGFTVHPLEPGVPVTIGDLEIAPFAGDHVATNCGEEWDTLPFLVRSLGGHGSFFSMVDIPITQTHVEWAAARAMRPGLVSWTNNSLDWCHMADYLKDRVEATQQTFVKMGTGRKLIESVWGAPVAMVTCAGGFAFVGDKQWLNARVFCVDMAAVCAQLQNVYKKEKFVAGVPGQTFVMKAGKLAAIEPAPWLGTTPKETWPARGKDPAAPVHDYAPGTGRRTISDDERAAIGRGLDELAGSIVGGRLFKSLASLLDSETGERRATFAVVTRDGDARHSYEYSSTTCSFVPGVADPERNYLAGLECWASDLAAVLAGELGPIALTFGRAKLWNALPKRLDFAIFDELHKFSHPLRRPAAYYKTYERLLGAARGAEIVVHRKQ